jgi:hypothetical protein
LVGSSTSKSIDPESSMPKSTLGVADCACDDIGNDEMSVAAPVARGANESSAQHDSTAAAARVPQRFVT